MNKSAKVFEEYVTESKFLWNSSDLDDTLIYCGVEALGDFQEDIEKAIDFERCPEVLARKMGYRLILKTVQMIVALYEAEFDF